MDDLRTWLGRKERGLSLLNQKQNTWENNIKLYNCTWFNEKYGGIDPERTDVHFANWYITTSVPLYYFRDPFIFIKPRNDTYGPFADTMEEVINYLWLELGLKQQFKKVILSSLLTPPGWMKLGYTAQFGEDVAKVETIKEKNLIANVKDAIMGVFKEKKDLTPEEQGNLDLNIKAENIFATWIPSWNILMPPGYHEINKMPWLIEIEDVSMVDFRNNPLYKNKKDAKADKTITDNRGGKKITGPNYENASPNEDDEDSIIRLYHAWDRRNQKRLTYSASDIHFEGKWPYDMEGFPYKPLIFEDTLPTDQESNPYPVDAITPIFPQILEQSNSRTMMTKHRKRCNTIIAIAKGMLTEEEIGAIEENEAVQIIEVPAGGNVQGFTPPSLPPDVYNVDSLIKQDLQMATKMGQLMFQAQPGQRTAAQASIAQQGLQVGAQARVDCVEELTKLTARCMSQLAWQFFDRDKIREIIGKDITPDMWPDLPSDRSERRRIIQSELSFKIDAGSTAPPKDETVDRKQLLDFLSFAASFAPERLKKDEVLKQGIKRWKFVKDVDKCVISGDEEEMKVAMQENQLMLQGAPQLVSPNENHMIHIQAHTQAKGNPLVDQHIVEHGKFLGIETNKPQQGDIRGARVSTLPETTRQGITNASDIDQSINNQGVSTGAQAEGKF